MVSAALPRRGDRSAAALFPPLPHQEGARRIRLRGEIARPDSRHCVLRGSKFHGFRPVLLDFDSFVLCRSFLGELFEVQLVVVLVIL